MDLKSFGSLPMPVQSLEEWRMLFEFLEGYFQNRGIETPVVVELGIQSNLQKAYYRQFLNARHIGVDLVDKYSTPDVLGDATRQEVVDQTLRLAGGYFDMVFIDAGQRYDEVRSYFNLWSPHARHIVALHPILTTPLHPDGTRRFWAELNETNRGQYRFVTFRAYLPADHPCHRYQMGTGLVIKG